MSEGGAGNPQTLRVSPAVVFFPDKTTAAALGNFVNPERGTRHAESGRSSTTTEPTSLPLLYTKKADI